MTTRLSALAFTIAASAALSAAPVSSHPGHMGAPNAAPILRSTLPSTEDAKALLDGTPRCRDWVAVPMGSSIVLAFVVYPVRADRAPVVIVTAPREGTNAWVRAVSDQLAAEGFIAIAPDLLTNMGPRHGDSESFATPDAMAEAFRRMGPAELSRRMAAIRQYAVTLPAADGKTAQLEELDARASRMGVSSSTRAPPRPVR